MNLVNYWMERWESSAEKPVLLTTSEQLITAAENTVSVFVSFLQEIETNGQLGLAKLVNCPTRRGGWPGEVALV